MTGTAALRTRLERAAELWPLAEEAAGKRLGATVGSGSGDPRRAPGDLGTLDRADFASRVLWPMVWAFDHVDPSGSRCRGPAEGLRWLAARADWIVESPWLSWFDGHLTWLLADLEAATNRPDLAGTVIGPCPLVVQAEPEWIPCGGMVHTDPDRVGAARTASCPLCHRTADVEWWYTVIVTEPRLLSVDEVSRLLRARLGRRVAPRTIRHLVAKGQLSPAERDPLRFDIRSVLAQFVADEYRA